MDFLITEAADYLSPSLPHRVACDGQFGIELL